MRSAAALPISIRLDLDLDTPGNLVIRLPAVNQSKHLMRHALVAGQAIKKAGRLLRAGPLWVSLSTNLAPHTGRRLPTS